MNRWLLACVVLGGFAASADAADMAVLGPYQPPPIAPLYSWTGFYIGVNIGGGAAPQSRVDTVGTFAPPGTSLGDMTARGVAGGGQLGCDYQVGSWVFGVGGLLDLSGMKGSDVLPTTILVNNSFVQTFATVTGRVGYTVLPNLLIYGKGGGAFVHDLYNIATPTGQAVPFFAGTMTVAPSTAVFNPSSVPTLVFDNNGIPSIVSDPWRSCCSSSARHHRRIGQQVYNRVDSRLWRGMGLRPRSGVVIAGIQLHAFRKHAGALPICDCSGTGVSHRYQPEHPHRSVRDQSSLRKWTRVLEPLVGAVRSLDRVAFQFREGHEGNRAPIVDIRACHADRTVRGSLLADLEDVL